jgi:hypothetical protein
MCQSCGETHREAAVEKSTGEFRQIDKLHSGANADAELMPTMACKKSRRQAIEHLP